MNKNHQKLIRKTMKGVFKPRSSSSGTENISKNVQRSERNFYDFKSLKRNSKNKSTSPENISNKHFSDEVKNNKVTYNSNNSSNYKPHQNVGTSEKMNKNEKQLKNGRSDKKFNNDLSVPGLDARFCGGLDNNRGTPQNGHVINEPSRIYHLNLGINHNPLSKIYDQGFISSNNTQDDCRTNNQILNHSLSSRKKYHTHHGGECHYCFKQTCICQNDNFKFTNNNYLFKTFQTRPSNSYFLPVLQYAFGQEKTNRNDFIILGLGIHHYIKELFNALDYNNEGFVYYKDVDILCKILGREVKSTRKSDMTLYSKCDSSSIKGRGESNMCSNSNCEVHLHMDRFSELICNTFTNWSENTSLERRKNTQLINAVVNITRRKESLDIITKQLNELEDDYMDHIKKSDLIHSQNSLDKNNCQKCNEGNSSYYTDSKHYVENIKLKRITLLQQQELQCLREVIEDLRVSLQCSDAENLGLRVKEFKMDEFSFSSSSENLSQKLDWTDDERDSIDRMIQGFPSDEWLEHSSMDSLWTTNSSKAGTLERNFPRYPLKQQGSRNDYSKYNKDRKLPTNEDDVDLENQIQNAFQKLFQTSQELEETRTDLESSVTEIQNKNSEIDKLNKVLTETKKMYQQFTMENTKLKEKIVLLKQENSNKNTTFEQLNAEIKVFKKELLKKDEEIVQIKQKLMFVKNKRNEDLMQLSATRNFIAKTFLEVKRHEEAIKDNLQNLLDKTPKGEDENCVKTSDKSEKTRKSFSVYHQGDDENRSGMSLLGQAAVAPQGPTIEKNCAVGTRTAVSYYGSSPSSFAEDGENRMDAPQAKSNLSPLRLRRRNEFENVIGPLSLSKEDSSRIPLLDRLNYDSSKKSTKTSSSIPICNKEKPPLTSFFNEEKPILEVKPHLIRPLSLTNSPTAELLRERDSAPLIYSDELKSSNRHSSMSRSKTLNKLHLSEDHINCQRETAQNDCIKSESSFYVNNRDNLINKERKSFNYFSTNSNNDYEHSVKKESLCNTMKNSCQGVGLENEPDSDYSYSVSKSKKSEDRHACIKTSTQILEGLEAEVEYLRKALDDEQMCG